jgi:hypothetical protein
MIERVKQYFAGTLAKSVIRKALTLLSGYLLALQVPGLSADNVAAFIASLTDILIALVPYLIAQIWSISAKAKAA